MPSGQALECPVVRIRLATGVERGQGFLIDHPFTHQEQVQDRIPPVAGECLPHRRGTEGLHQGLAEQWAEAFPVLLQPGGRKIIGAVLAASRRTLLISSPDSSGLHWP